MARCFFQFTPSELMERGAWDNYCSMTGTSPWAVNEGCMGSNEEIELTHSQASALGLTRSAADEDWRIH